MGYPISSEDAQYKLLFEHFAGEASWWGFTEPEQRIISKTARCFARELREAGFLPDKVRDGEGAAG